MTTIRQGLISSGSFASRDGCVTDTGFWLNNAAAGDGSHPFWSVPAHQA